MTPQVPPENWFYTNTRVPNKSGGYSFQFLNKQPRPGNLEDEIVQDFLGETDLDVFLENDIERHLRIALRRAADAAVKVTLDAEGQGVVYETAEERAAGTREILRRLRDFAACVAIFSIKSALLTNDTAVSNSANELSLAVRELQQAINGQQEAS